MSHQIGSSPKESRETGLEVDRLFAGSSDMAPHAQLSMGQDVDRSSRAVAAEPQERQGLDERPHQEAARHVDEKSPPGEAWRPATAPCQRSRDAGRPIPARPRTAVRIMLTSRQPIWIGWGKDLVYLYNDPYKSIIGGKDAWALGRPTAEVWREIWDDIGPMLSKAMLGDEGTSVEEQLLIMERHGYPEKTYYTFSYSPIPDGRSACSCPICGACSIGPVSA